MTLQFAVIQKYNNNLLLICTKVVFSVVLLQVTPATITSWTCVIISALYNEIWENPTVTSYSYTQRDFILLYVFLIKM